MLRAVTFTSAALLLPTAPLFAFGSLADRHEPELSPTVPAAQPDRPTPPSPVVVASQHSPPRLPLLRSSSGLATAGGFSGNHVETWPHDRQPDSPLEIPFSLGLSRLPSRGHSNSSAAFSEHQHLTYEPGGPSLWSRASSGDLPNEGGPPVLPRRSVPDGALLSPLRAPGPDEMDATAVPPTAAAPPSIPLNQEHYAEAVAELALQNKWILVELDMAQDFYFYGPSSLDRQPASYSEAVDLMEGEAAHFLGRELWEELNRGSTTTSTGSSSSSSTERLIALRRLLRTLRDRLQQGAFRGGFNNVELEPWLLDDQRMMEVLFQHGGALVAARARRLAHEVVDGEGTTDSRAVSVQVDRTCVFAAALWKKREEARRRSSASALRSSDFVRDDVEQVFRQDRNLQGPLRRRDTLLELLMGSSIPATQPSPVRVDSFPATQPDHQVDSFPATQPDQVGSFIPATQPDHDVDSFPATVVEEQQQEGEERSQQLLPHFDLRETVAAEAGEGTSVRRETLQESSGVSPSTTLVERPGAASSSGLIVASSLAAATSGSPTSRSRVGQRLLPRNYPFALVRDHTHTPVRVGDEHEVEAPRPRKARRILPATFVVQGERPDRAGVLTERAVSAAPEEPRLRPHGAQLSRGDEEVEGSSGQVVEVLTSSQELENAEQREGAPPGRVRGHASGNQDGRQHGGERHDDEVPNGRAAGMINSRGPCHRLRRLGASEHLGEVAAVDRHVRSNTSSRRGKRPLVGKDKRKYQLPVGLTATGPGHTQILVTVQQQTKKRSSSSSAAATTGGGGSRAYTERIKIDPAQYPSVEAAIAEAVKVLNEKLLTNKN